MKYYGGKGFGAGSPDFRCSLCDKHTLTWFTSTAFKTFDIDSERPLCWNCKYNTMINHCIGFYIVSTYSPLNRGNSL